MFVTSADAAPENRYDLTSQRVPVRNHRTKPHATTRSVLQSDLAAQQIVPACCLKFWER